MENRTVEGKEPDENDDFWASRVSPEAARELRELVPRLAVLYDESRRCDLVGNTSARWGFSALLPEPLDDSLHQRLMKELYEEIAASDGPYDSASICNRALRRAPPEAILRIHYQLENSDVFKGTA